MSKELLEALSDLRSDPTIKSVLAERRATGADGASPVRRYYDGPVMTSGSDTGHLLGDGGDDGCHPPQGSVPFPQGSPQGSHGFIEERNVARYDLGTSNWLQQHRDDLSHSEKKRVENRLRAENMFAVAQLEYEQLVGDLRKPPTTTEPESTKEEVSSREAAEQSPAVRRGLQFDDNGVLPQHQPSPPRPPLPGHVLDHGAAGLPASATLGLPVQPAVVVTNETEEELYLRKQQELLGSSPKPAAEAPQPITLANGAAQPQPVAAAAAAAADLKNLHDSAPMHLPYKPSVQQQRFDHDFATLVDAIHQRDRTIERLERLMREDKDYYEGQLIQKTSEIDNMRSSCESRVQAMKVEMTHVLEKTRRGAELDQHDIKGKLASMEHSYERGLAELRTEFSTFLSSYQADCDKRMREITAAAESSIRTARDAYTVDQAKALDKERKSLVDRIQKEQDYMLKDAEMDLRSEIDKVLFNKVKAQVEASVRAQLRAELIPIVKRELLDSIKAQVSTSSREELNKYVKQQLDHLTMQQSQFQQEKQQWLATRGAGGPLGATVAPPSNTLVANGATDGGSDTMSVGSARLSSTMRSQRKGQGGGGQPQDHRTQEQKLLEQREKAQKEAQLDHEARMGEGQDEIRQLEEKLGLRPQK